MASSQTLHRETYQVQAKGIGVDVALRHHVVEDGGVLDVGSDIGSKAQAHDTRRAH